MKPYLLCIFLLVCMVTVAQVTPQKKPIKTINQKYTNNVQKKASHETDEICSLLNLNKEISFVRTDTINNGKKSNNIKYGIEHQRYVQYLKGIKIEDSDLRVHKIGNSIVQVNGHITMLDDVETNPKIGKKEAELKAIEYFKLEYPNKSLRLTFNKNKANSSELVLISNLYDEEDPKLHLTYKMLIENQEPLICEYVFVDAINGEIVNTKNTILNVQGTGQTRYSGTKTIDTEKKSDTLYNLVGSFGSITAIRTLNMHDTTDLNNMTDFTDNDNSWTRSEMHLDDAALDVHWAMMKACEYFYYVHGRMHYKDNGVQIISGIHNGLRNISRYNSAYDFFSFGDGLTDNISGTPDYNVMVSLDFVAHEFGHALCANTAQLTDIKETGAIQEGLSDIWAVCIENYAAPEKQKWLLGEEVLLSVYNCERDLRYPKNHYLPDTYKGQYWMSTDGCKPRSDRNDNCYIHRNCGVMDRWFYLLTEGGSQNGDSVSGVGLEKAAQIVYLAETSYITKYATYSSVRENMIDAAKDIFGECSQEAQSVIDAWHAVGVGGKTFSTLSNLTISEDTTINACSVEINNIHLTNGATLDITAPNGVIFSGDTFLDLGTIFFIE